MILNIGFIGGSLECSSRPLWFHRRVDYDHYPAAGDDRKEFRDPSQSPIGVMEVENTEIQ